MNTSKKNIAEIFQTKPLALAVNKVAASAALGFSLLLVAIIADAGPQGGNVVAGSANIQQKNLETLVNQSSSRAIIDWNSFNVGSQESVTFRQPSADSATLNRIIDSDPSTILGRINANGQVFLVNPNGIVFGKTAQINVGSLLASTSNITNQNFMAGNLRFDQPGKLGATVENRGTITIAEGGFIGLVAPYVGNSGVINAKLGKVSLAGVDAFVLDLNGDGLINLIIGGYQLQSTQDANGRALSTYIDQSGEVNAVGGVVMLTASTIKDLVDSVINVSGIIRATGFESQAGKISLIGDSHTNVAISGDISVGGDVAGEIDITGRDIALESTARIDANNVIGSGGNIFIGGNFHGAGTLANARNVHIDSGAVIEASGGNRGGNVVVWSDEDTIFNGEIDAGCNSSFVEVSAKHRLGFNGNVRASQLLLDPANLIIDTSGSETLASVDNTGDFTVKANTINYILANGTSVTLQAAQDITQNAGARIDGRSASEGVAGGGLTLDAGRNIHLSDLIILNDGKFNAIAGGDFSQGANSAIVTGNGSIDITTGKNISANYLVTTGDLKISSDAGSIDVAEVISGLDNMRAHSLDIAGRDGVTLRKGALVTGTTTIKSANGQINTRGAAIDSIGAVNIAGINGIETDAILTPAAVTLTSTNGNVLLHGVVAGASGDLKASAKATSLAVHANGSVSINGAAVNGDVRVDGKTSTERASAIAFDNAAIFSGGSVVVLSNGDIDFGSGGIFSGGRIFLDSQAGHVNAGGGAIEVANSENLSINAHSDILSTGLLSTSGGEIRLESREGNINLADVVTWRGDESGDTGVFIARATLGDIVLNKSLGGAETGYGLITDAGYKPGHRPNVGFVGLFAGNDIELNGLNLDGNTDPSLPGYGLLVSAGRRLISNEIIAVNKGDILLEKREGNVADINLDVSGIYLGNAVYSRGYDSDFTAAGKTAYNISIISEPAAPNTSNGGIYLFDNTNEIFLIGNASQSTAHAKIIVGNNVANYLSSSGDADPTLVDTSNPTTVTVTGILNGARLSPGPIHLHDIPSINTVSERLQFVIPLSSESVSILGSTHINDYGIGLKIQLFNQGYPTDADTTVDESNMYFYRFFNEGSAGLFQNNTGFQPTISSGSLFDSNGNPLWGYEVSGQIVQTDNSASHSVTRVLLFDGTLISAAGEAQFDQFGHLVSVSLDSTMSSNSASQGATNGFSAVGGFGNQTTTNTSSPNGFNLGLPASTTPAPPLPPSTQVTTLPVTQILPPVTQTLPMLPNTEMPQSSSLAEIALLDTSLLNFDAVVTAPSSAGATYELVFNQRPSTSADLGRGASYSGVSQNVFSKKYRIAQTSDGSVCASDDIAVAGQSGSRVCTP